MEEDAPFKDVILVTDKVLAASLAAMSYIAIAAFEDSNGKFYCLYRISKQLRNDLREYVAPGLAINVRMVRDELADLEEALYSNRFAVADKMHSQQPSLFHQEAPFS